MAEQGRGRAPPQPSKSRETGSGLGDVNSVKAWQETIPGSKLEVLPGDSYHVAATDPDVCARKVREFFDRLKT